MKPAALALLALFVTLAAGSVFGLDLGCSDDCERGAPCRSACASCGCNAGAPAPASLDLPAVRPLVASTVAVRGEPLAGVVRPVLHVPLFS